MKTTPSAVQALIYGGGEWDVARCWTFYLSNGTDVRRWTNGDDVSFGGHTWLGGAVGIEGGLCHSQSGTDPDTIEVVLAGTISLGGAPLTQAALGLTFKGARVLVEDVYFDGPNPGGTAVGSMVVFDGTIYGVDPRSLRTKLTIMSPMAAAESRKGLRIVSAPCPFAVYDADCGATIQESSTTIAAGSTLTRVKLAAIPPEAAPGSRLTFDTGALADVALRVRAVGADYVDLERGVASVPAAGVSVTVRRGCDHTAAGCRLLGNIVRFGGTPYAPVEDLVGGAV